MPKNAWAPGGTACPRSCTSGNCDWSCTSILSPAPVLGPVMYSYCSMFKCNLNPRSAPTTIIQTKLLCTWSRQREESPHTNFDPVTLTLMALTFNSFFLIGGWKWKYFDTVTLIYDFDLDPCDINIEPLILTLGWKMNSLYFSPRWPWHLTFDPEI